MQRFILTSLIVLFALPSLAGTINFDENTPANSNRILLSEEYRHLGVHIEATDDGAVWSGLSDGDPGGWMLEGTSGSAFAGFNGRSYSMTLWMDEPVENFSIDVARSAGSSEDAGFTLAGYRAGGPVEDVFVDLGALAINEWATATLSEPVDEVQLIGSGGREPFGVDNVRWGADSGGGGGIEVIEIDVKPGASDVVNPFSRGVVPVVLFGSESFDVEQVDFASLAFGPGGAPVSDNVDPHVLDLDEDGYADLLCKHAVPDSGIAIGDVEACLVGETVDGVKFEGCAPVRTTPLKTDAAPSRAKGRNR